MRLRTVYISTLPLTGFSEKIRKIMYKRKHGQVRLGRSRGNGLGPVLRVPPLSTMSFTIKKRVYYKKYRSSFADRMRFSWMTDKDFHHLFGKADIDFSGFLTKSEFSIVMEAVLRTMLEHIKSPEGFFFE